MSSPYFNRLGQQSGVQISTIADAVAEAMALLAVSERVVAMPVRANRGRIDQAFLVDRSDAQRSLGRVQSNLVRIEHEGMMQVVETLDAGAAGVVVSRLVPATAAKRYVSVDIGGGVLLRPDLIESVVLIPGQDMITVAVKVVDMEGGSGAYFDFAAPVTVSGIPASAYTLDVSQMFIDGGMSLSGGRVNVTAGTRNFTMEMRITDGGYSGTVLVQVGNASDSEVIVGSM